MEHQEQIKSITEKLLELLGIKSEVSVEMKESSKEAEAEKTESAEIELSTQDTGMLIGYHGETLEALQLILSLCVAKELGSFVRISLEVGEYKKNRTDYLRQLAEQAREQALSQGEPVTLPNLKSWERREVHLLLQNDPDVISESIGEGRDRSLTVRRK